MYTNDIKDIIILEGLFDKLFKHDKKDNKESKKNIKTYDKKEVDNAIKDIIRFVRKILSSDELKEFNNKGLSIPSNDYIYGDIEKDEEYKSDDSFAIITYDLYKYSKIPNPRSHIHETGDHPVYNGIKMVEDKVSEYIIKSYPNLFKSRASVAGDWDDGPIDIELK